ncbi:MAG: cytochrome c biogenesis protein CcsA [Planctomycetes bacterium]|nr:cytochrome c biogenesis protein CcsA [Planctomycetota bacterium]
MRTLFWLAAASCAAAAADFPSQLALDEFRLVAVLEGGRWKPLDTFAREELEFITGKPVWHGEDPAATVLSMVFEAERWETVELFRAGHPDLVNLMGLKRDGRVRDVFSYRELAEHAGLRAEIRRRVEAGGRPAGARDEAVDGIRAKMDAFGSIGTRLAVLPPPPGYPQEDAFAFVEGAEGVWAAARAPRGLYPAGWLEETERLWAEAGGAIRGRDAAAANRALASLAARLAAVNPERYPKRSRLAVEHAATAWQPFRAAWILYFAACAVLALSLGPARGRWRVAGYVLLGAGFACHLAGIGMRAYVAQRAPWANLYETIVASSLMCATLAIVFEAIRRSALAGLSAAFLSGVGLIGASLLPLEFRTIEPLAPALRSWGLKYHVLAMAGAGGAFTLAFGLSCFQLFMHFVKHDVESSESLEDQSCQANQAGFFCLATGIVLGAVWADSAWGRYWRWDPKEIWATVCLFVYAAAFYGRLNGWCRGPRAAYASILGYFAILFTYFGVNLMLTGRHLYANPT